MPHDEDHSEQHPFHMEGSTVIFDQPPSATEAAREARESEAHEFARSQVRTNERTGWFNGLLVLATFATVVIGVWQGSISQTAANAARKAADEAVKSTYMACLSAQATQTTFLQMQMGALDAHASAVATVEQTAANLFAERAVIAVNTRWPLPSEISKDQLALPYTLKNTGHSTATTVKIGIQALLTADKDLLRFRTKGYKEIYGKYISAGAESSSETPDNTKPRMTYDISVHDANDKVVSFTDARVQSLYAGGPEMVAVYGYVAYSDFSGSHRMQFCEPMYWVKGGSSRTPTPNEKRCVEYNSRSDKFSFMPELNKLVAPAAPAINPILCKEPDK